VRNTRKVWLWAGLPKSSFWVTTGKIAESCTKADAEVERSRNRRRRARGYRSAAASASRMGKQTTGLSEHAKAHVTDAPCERVYTYPAALIGSSRAL
jgi:hypothetical protein